MLMDVNVFLNNEFDDLKWVVLSRKLRINIVVFIY